MTWSFAVENKISPSLVYLSEVSASDRAVENSSVRGSLDLSQRPLLWENGVSSVLFQRVNYHAHMALEQYGSHAEWTAVVDGG